MDDGYEFEDALIAAAGDAPCQVYETTGPQCHSGRRHPECVVAAMMPVIDRFRPEPKVTPWKAARIAVHTVMAMGRSMAASRR